MKEKALYNIRTVRDLLALEGRISGKKLLQDGNTHAHIHELSNGKYILYPALGQNGLLIENKETLDSILSSRIPIEEEKPNSFQQKQELILQLPNSVPWALEYLNIKLGTDIDYNTLNFNEESLNIKVKKYGFLKSYEHFHMELGILFCEIIRNYEPEFEYKLEKKYGYNPYYQVTLKSESQTIDPWHYLNIALLEKKQFRFTDVLNKVLQFNS